MTKPIIQIKNLTKIYGEPPNETIALGNISLEIEKGEFTSIMGPSGCGKSTLMHIIGLLDKPTKGILSFENQPTKDLSENESAKIRNQKIGFIFQSFNLLDRTSSLDNVILPLQYNQNFKADERKNRAKKLLGEVGLEDRLGNFPSQLSGGQQQKIAIARALICDPLLILADEPTGNLDSKSGDQIMSILKNLNDQGKTVIVVSHDLHVAKKTGRIISMKDGRIISDRKNK